MTLRNRFPRDHALSEYDWLIISISACKNLVLDDCLRLHPRADRVWNDWLPAVQIQQTCSKSKNIKIQLDLKDES